MATPTFFHSNLQITDNQLQLSQQESSHALRSRRLKLGDEINVINGAGLIAKCILDTSDGRQLTVSVVSSTQVKKPRKSLSIAVAVPKGDRQRTMVDMLTQLGVRQIFPLQCEYSIAKFKSNTHEKWLRTAVEASKQSHNPWLPLIHDVHTIPEILQYLNERDNIGGYYADAEGEWLSNLPVQPDGFLVCIGPEGGFSKIETDTFMQSGMQAIRLSSAILRTETAAVSFAAQAQKA
jgi:16S rRNA (uracil1498-N3)-methyltransferase